MWDLIKGGYSRYTMYTQVSNVHAYVHSKVVEKLVGVSLSEVEYVLRDCALCEVKNAWMMKVESRSKLGMV